MKRTMISGLFITAALLASPVFAAEDLCGANLQTLKDAQVSTNTNLSAEQKKGLSKTWNQANKAHKAGDDKKCIAITSQAINDLKTTGSSSDGAK
ncbi:hypothetical protein SFA35_04085 [Pseudomonas sp. HR96]|uniref:hypothetical protein n=1 Tax=Pseudomonas sp. HR96 TaxID=1027966 RepID=UPI002A75A4B8|nr:hypothetical protein [Pseudomonas sp. HR96]WPP00567.1 hypothetical protein SFA35_04085 [Pseudomonas sp. HR96]